MQHIFHLPRKPDTLEYEERCAADAFVCTKKWKCLRFRAAHDQGVPLADHSKLDNDCKKSLPLTGNSAP